MASDSKMEPGMAAPSARSRELSELEYALIISGNAFGRWAERCMEAAGVRGLGMQDVLVLHAVNHRARGKRLADICMVMNIEDPHIVSYALKKLRARGLVEVVPVGREKHYQTTEKGDAACLRYRAVREDCLVRSLEWLGGDANALLTAASFLRTMTALYEQAARLATVTAAPTPGRPAE